MAQLPIQQSNSTSTPLNNSYIPRVDDYVIWHRGPSRKFEGWVYFVDREYITIEIGVKDKPPCQYTRDEKHKKIHTLLLCHPCYWNELEYVKNRRDDE
jgi:hypothetical protein